MPCTKTHTGNRYIFVAGHALQSLGAFPMNQGVIGINKDQWKFYIRYTILNIFPIIEFWVCRGPWMVPHLLGLRGSIQLSWDLWIRLSQIRSAWQAKPK